MTKHKWIKLKSQTFGNIKFKNLKNKHSLIISKVEGAPNKNKKFIIAIENNKPYISDILELKTFATKSDALRYAKQYMRTH